MIFGNMQDPFSDHYVNSVIHQHGYESPEAVIARLDQWIGKHGGENSVSLLMYEARGAISKLRGENRADEFDIEGAAKTLAECMDYPWGHMPEQGREEMRKHAQRVLDAAISHQEKEPTHE